MLGKTISHYKILEKLGEGGMGVVYKAEDLTLGRTVALKFLPPDSIAREADRARLVHEARAAAALLHPNICPVHEIAEADGRPFIAMACIEGQSLKDRISDGPLPLDKALSIASQIGDALAAAHTKGIIHRDIKPGNVMLLPDGRPMLMDFGLAKVSGATRLTRTGMTMGTVAYMSPEQVEGRKVDHRSDIWALGVVLYEMVSGRTPFTGEYEAALLYGIMNEDPKQLAVEGSDVPAGLDGIIAKALAKDPAKRYQKTEELVADLDTLARAREALPAGRAVPVKGLRRLWRRWRPWQRVAAVASLVALAAIASVLFMRYGPSAPEARRYSLAVMDFRDLGTQSDPTVSAQLTELVSTGLIQADLMRVVSSELLHDLRRRLFGSPRGAIDNSQTLELARKVEATLFLTGTIGQSGSSQLVNWRLVDARNGENVGAGRSEGTALAGLADQIIGAAVPRIAHACGVEAKGGTMSVESLTTDSPRAYQHYTAGRLAREECRQEDAIAEFERAVAQDSTFALAYLWLGTTYGVYSDWDRAGKCFEKAWNMRARLGIKDQLRIEAARYAADGLIGESVRTLREMHERWPDDRQILTDLRNWLAQSWSFADALESDEKGQRLYPDDANFGGLDYLRLLIKLGRPEEAVRAGKSWIKRHPNEPWGGLGIAYSALGMPDSAEAAFRKSVRLDPRSHPEIMASSAYRRGNLEGAISSLENILEQRDLSAGKRMQLTKFSELGDLALPSLYVEAGRYQKARGLCREYMTLSSIDQPEFRMLLAMGQAQEVRDLYGQWSKSDNSNDFPHQLGIALAMLGDAKGAREAAERLSYMESKWGAKARYCAFEVQARAALAEHDAKTALNFLAKMKQLGVPFGGYVDIDYRTALAMAYRMDGRLAKAAEVHKEMLRIYGGHALSHYELGTIYEEMKRPAEAKKEYTKFLDMWSDADEGLPQLVDARKRLAAL